jgi:hypothetical protein
MYRRCSARLAQRRGNSCWAVTRWCFPLDELPPYLEYAVTVPVGNGDLAVVTTTALGNLFVAVAEMDNVCLVLSDLAGSNFSLGQANLQAAFDRAVQGITSESRRIAVPITPVNPNGDELYHILRKRLFRERCAGGRTSSGLPAAYRMRCARRCA